MHRWPIKQSFKFIMGRSNNYLYKHATAYLAYSDMTKRYLVSRGVDAKKIFVGTQAMSPSLMPKPTQKIKLNSKKLQLLYLGYFRPEKGVDILINAVGQLPVAKFDLHIVGDGPEMNALKRLASHNKNIYFHGYVPNRERANWLASVDIFVLPTYFDPWAHTVTESLYYGTPVIVTKSAAASTVIVQGRNGFTFNAGAVEELAEFLNGLNPDKVSSFKNYIRISNNIRLYDVASDSDNIARAIKQALNRASII
jgi:glycosyltransferase involved in cell wall biosynthesis